MDDETAKKVWEEAKERLSKELRQDVYGRWIAPLGSPKEHDGKLTFGVANDFYVDWLEEHYSPKIVDALKSKGFDGEIEFRVNGELKPKRIPEREKPIPAERKTPAELTKGLNPRYTLENLVVGDSNRLAVAAVEEILRKPASIRPYFYGSVGSGKTHLLHAALGEFVKKGIAKPGEVYVIGTEALANGYIEAIQRRELVSFRENRRRKFLGLDELDFLVGKEGIQKEVRALLDAITDSGGQIILTGQKPIAELGLLPDLASRLSGATQIQIYPSGLEEKIKIAQNYLLEKGVKEPNQEHVRFIAGMVGNDVRTLKGAIDTYTLALAQQQLDLEGIGTNLSGTELERILASYKSKDSPTSYTDIVKAVADMRTLHEKQIMAESRGKQAVADARAEAVYIARAVLGHSFPMIGRYFGRNHSSAVVAYEKVAKNIARDPSYGREIDALIARLKNGEK